MYRKLLSMALFILFAPMALLAQGTVTGVVTDGANGETLPGANVIIEELSRGAATNVDGEYEITNVPSGTYTIVATFLGFKRSETTVQVGSGEVTVDFELEPDYFGLEDVVVTGVGQGTQTTKLGFSVGKVGEETLSEVPAVDPANALRGKMSGVTVVQSSGDPSAAPDIRLRGSTSISGNQQPLIIVDGVITDGSLRDINMSDVESIEVIKGAAGASIYGSLAGNGVIQIITKRNAEQVNEPQVTVRSEYGFSQIANEYPIATKHPYPTDDVVLTADGEAIASWPSANAGSYDDDRRFDNDFPVYYDNLDALFTSNPYMNNSISLANSGQQYNYRISFDNYSQGQVLEPLGDYKRNTVRFNADYVPNEKLTAKFNVSYINVESPTVSEQGQGANYFYSVLVAEPVFNLSEKDDDGNYNNAPRGYGALGSNFQNPLYVASNRETQFQRDRILGGASIEYAFNDNLSINGRQSLDKYYTSANTYYPVGYETPSPSQTLNNGFDSRTKIERTTSISELWVQYNQQFDDFNLGTIVKYLYEDREYDEVELEGYDFPVSGLRNIGSANPDNYDIGSEFEEVKVENFFLNVDLDYQDKIIASGLIRRDGSSGFGSEERWQTYYRGSLAYRITQDFEFENINEWKVRASYGTSGQRPPFEAQYETFSVSSTGISPGVLGNNEIKPSVVAELELGTNITFFDRYNFEANYALTNVKNDYLQVPLSSAAGFSSQWQNVGEIESSSLEFMLSGQLYDSRDFSWNSSMTFSRVTQEVTNLGDAAPFTRQSDGAIPLFRFEAGVPYGTMYGNKALTSLDQLTVVDGEVVNPGSDVTGDGMLTRDDYEINSQGYVIPKGTHGNAPTDENDDPQATEQITYLVDEFGVAEVTSIGNTNPDFTVGFSNTFNYKGLGLYVLLDWVQGGDVYNYTKQLLYFNNRHKDQQDFAEQGFDPTYTDGGSAIYNAASASSYFVEDASFVKLREVALSYTLDGDKLGSLGNYMDQIRLSVSGRNLLTFTEYTGWDPEVALRTNATNFRIDEYSYPNYRTFTGSVQIRF
ncbi:MAG: SusC/RagA family TonB-linked outer membrane protein [Gracilimonas sp.]